MPRGRSSSNAVKNNILTVAVPLTWREAPREFQDDSILQNHAIPRLMTY